MKIKLLAALVATAALAGCGGDDSKPAAETPAASTTPAETDPSAIKTYLLDHTARLQEHTGAMAAEAQAYYDLAKAADFDYAKLLADKREEVAASVKKMQESYIAANPSYEEMEGIVAGVPSLADYD